MIGILHRSLNSRDTVFWKRLYTMYVRLHLEYTVQAWNLHLIMYIKLIEKVQQRVTKKPHGLKHLTYSEGCRLLGLLTLEVFLH